MFEGGVVALAFVAGAIPFSNLIARRVKGVDLRDTPYGTVSGTSIYRVAGFGPLAVSGILDMTKGAIGPLVAGDRCTLAALAGGAAVIGHNWSPFLGGKGGRGVAPALGALAVTAWPGMVVLLGCMVLGKLVKETGLGGFVGEVALAPVLAIVEGGCAAAAGGAVAVPMLAKRIFANAPPPDRGADAYVRRLLFDRDPDTPTP
jgi:acyl phosphate:glycerol-3-phosphate acyltransferase